MSARPLGVALALLVAGCLGGTSLPPPSRPPPLEPACPEAPATQPFELRAIDEASGLARSGRLPCLLWVHEDSGNEPFVFATDGRGRHLGALRVAGPNVDREDMASFTLDGMPYLLVADIGDNGRSRADVSFVVFPEPDVANLTWPFQLEVPDAVVVTVHRPGLPFDAESVAVDVAGDAVLVVSKGGAGPAQLGAGPDQALYAAPLSAALRAREVTLEEQAGLTAVRPGPGGSPADSFLFGANGGAATALDLDPGGQRLALLTYREVLVWDRSRGQAWSEAVQAPPRGFPVPAAGARQMEAVAFSADGAWLLVGAEQGEPNSMLTVLPAR